MSFGGGTDYNRAINNLGGTSNLALNTLFPAAMRSGQPLINQGFGNTQAGANFFSNLLGGNRAATTSLLGPDINRIRGAQEGTLQGMSTLMPRGGGRSGSLFALPFNTNAQIQSLYDTARGGAGQALAQIGQGQLGAGANLFGVGNSALGSANNANQAMVDAALQQKQMSNGLFGSLGQGAGQLASLAMMFI